MATCPKCSRTFSPTLLAEGLSSKGCKTCGGVFVDLLAYRAWADKAGGDTSVHEPDVAAITIDDTSEAILCPNCSAVMIKYRLSASSDNKLDFCANCDEVWFDGGEWDQLASLGLRRALGSVFTEPWQRRLREETAEGARESVLRERFGKDYGRISEIRAWIQAHPQFEDILAWLGDRDVA